MLVLREAKSRKDLEQVHRLNYRTFVEEIPQHGPNGARLLVDDLLATSTCLIALRGDRLVGMVAISESRPFSLDRKLPGLDRHVPADLSQACEIRLLAIEPEERGSLVFAALINELQAVARQRGYAIGLISATTRQMKLYLHLGAQPFGPLLGTDDAPFQGMMFTWDQLSPALDRLLQRQRRNQRQEHRQERRQIATISEASPKNEQGPRP